MRHRTAFTLIELLVVVAIIVALLAILLPSVSKAVETAQTAVCGSNLKQVGNSFTVYAADRFGILPSVGNIKDGRTAVLYHWAKPAAEPLRFDYLGGSWEVFSCPTWIDAPWNMDSEDPLFRKVRYVATSNTLLDPSQSPYALRDGDGNGNADNFMLQRLTDPGTATRLLLGDHLLESTPDVWNWSLGNSVPHQNNATGGPRGGNGAYLDGHVQWKDRDAMHNNFSYQGAISDGFRDYYW